MGNTAQIIKHPQPCCPLCKDSQLKTRLSAGGRLYLDCSRCGLISLLPSLRLSSVDEQARYLSHNNDPRDSRYRKFLSRLLDPFEKLLSPTMQGLDYGCGPGPTIQAMLEEKGYTVKNYDPYFFPYDFRENEQFDFITCTEAIEHFADPLKEFQKLFKLLAPGGWLGVMTQIYDEAEPVESWWYAKDPTHISLYRPESFHYLASKFHWQAIEAGQNIRFFHKENCL